MKIGRMTMHELYFNWTVFEVSSTANDDGKFRKVGTERNEMMGSACRGSWCVVNTAFAGERLLPYADDNRNKYG